MLTNNKKMTKAELEKLGIKCILTDAYHVGPYKYSNLKDALAEAARSAAKQKNKDL
jgi:queuine/archaeosine tRNA-ribosyltransferase